jgi:hypothetical protein
MPPRGKERRGVAPGGPAADKASPAFWRALKTGDFVGVSDAEAFAAALAEGGGSSVDYTVGDIRRFALRGPGDPAARGEYRFVELRGGGPGPLYLAVVDLPESLELRLYFIPAGLESGTRDELIDRGETWLFLPPPDPDDFRASELEYAPYPDVPELAERDRGLGRKFVFSRVGTASNYGESLDTRSPVIITEYEASAPEGESGPANPLLLVLEEGWMRSDGTQPEEGGYLTILLGKTASAADLDVYPA